MLFATDIGGTFTDRIATAVPELAHRVDLGDLVAARWPSADAPPGEHGR